MSKNGPRNSSARAKKALLHHFRFCHCIATNIPVIKQCFLAHDGMDKLFVDFYFTQCIGSSIDILRGQKIGRRTPAAKVTCAHCFAIAGTSVAAVAPGADNQYFLVLQLRIFGHF